MTPAWVLAIGIACAGTISAQSAWQPGHEGIGFGQPHTQQSVRMVSSPELAVTSGLRVGQPQELALRFAVNSGLHINSHAPHSQFLIPTTLKLDAPTGVEISTVEYPPGVDYHLAFDPKDALNVYTGEFGVLVRMRAHPGHYTLHGQLHYQACDNRTCSPPKTLPLTLDLTAK
ncbi:MAG: protein-disulfide reductase DsbD domain-containing protein [Acidobacteriaceae bacterium]